MGAPKNRQSVALGAMLRIGDTASFNKVRNALREAGGRINGHAGACEKLSVAHRTFMRWREDMPRLETLVQTVRAESSAIKAAADGDDGAGEPASDAAE